MIGLCRGDWVAVTVAGTWDYVELDSIWLYWNTWFSDNTTLSGIIGGYYLCANTVEIAVDIATAC